MHTQENLRDQFIIGLTGNIGTGKSTVLNMLRHLGAYGIDADEVTKKIYQDPFAQEKIVRHFGQMIIDDNGNIDRSRIAEIVFKDENELHKLEDIIHPLVSKAIKQLIKSSQLPIIVIEAIKLLESDLKDLCDSIWVVDADINIITNRLIKYREMNLGDVKNRLSNQSSPQEKKDKADVVINNGKELHFSWEQVSGHWQSLFEKNSQFLEYKKRSVNAQNHLEKSLIRPFSDSLSNLGSIFNENKTVKLFPSHFPLKFQEVEKLAARRMIFRSSDTQETTTYSIWKVSTFTMDCEGFFLDQIITAEPLNQFPITDIEFLANLHHVEEIIIPVRQLLKEEASFYQGKGFSSMTQNTEPYTSWLKAGYNLFIKRLWNTTTLFRNDTSH